MVKYRLATEAVLRTVTRAQRCLAKGGAVGWGFWDVKGGFQNVKEQDVLKEIEKSEEGKRWIPWIGGFFRDRRFKLEWDRKMRGRGKTNLVALQGSSLSPIIFLIWMTSIIRKMEIVIKEVVLYENKLPSYVDKLYVNICNWNRIHMDMKLLLKRIDEVVNQVAKENHLPLEESKHEVLVLRKKRRQKNKDMKWVKWIGIIMDKSLSFQEHWKSRITKARKMLEQLNGLGNSMWGISANSWRFTYTRMISAVALWGAELG